MTLDQDITKLVTDSTPKAPILTPLKRFLMWLFFSLLIIIGCVWHFGFNTALSAQFSSPFFWLECLSAIAVLVISGYATLRLSQPEYSARGRLTGYVLPFVIWVLIVGVHLAESFFHHALPLHLDQGAGCSKVVTIIGLVPTLLMFLLVKRAAPIRFFLIGFLLFLSAFSTGLIGIQLICPSTNPLHILVWHGGPVILISILGLLIGKRLLKW